MRRRLRFINQRTSHVLSLQSMFSRCLAAGLNGNEIKKLKLSDADKFFKDPFQALIAKNSISTIAFLDSKAKQIE